MLSPRRSAHLGVVAGSVLLVANMTALILTPMHYKPVPRADVGTLAPDFTLADAQGRSVALASLRGQAVVLCFTSLHCPISSAYAARINSLARSYANDSRVQFLALNVDSDTTPIQVRVDAKITGRPFPTLIDEHSRVAEAYSALPSPTFIVVDPQGIVRYRGPFDDSVTESSVIQHFCADTLRDLVPDSVSLATNRPR